MAENEKPKKPLVVSKETIAQLSPFEQIVAKIALDKGYWVLAEEKREKKKQEHT